MFKRKASDIYSVAKFCHIFGGSLMVRVEKVAMSLMYWVITFISCVVFRSGAAGYRV